VLLGVLGAVIPWGLSGLLQKFSTRDISGELSSIAFLLGFLPLAVGIFAGTGLGRRLADAGFLVGSPFWLSLATGLLLALGNVAILIAFASHGQASIIAPLGGLYSLLSIPLAMWLFGDRLTGRQLTGIVLALAAVVALSQESAPSAASSADVEGAGPPPSMENS
jgi:drug/metabolite transporter (DMT)-like permease